MLHESVPLNVAVTDADTVAEGVNNGTAVELIEGVSVATTATGVFPPVVLVQQVVVLRERRRATFERVGFVVGVYTDAAVVIATSIVVVVFDAIDVTVGVVAVVVTIGGITGFLVWLIVHRCGGPSRSSRTDVWVVT